jgi:hypothetical protein
MRAQLLSAPPVGGQNVDEPIAIHRRTATSTLLNALRLSYPAVQRIVGTEFFEALADAFIRAHLPRSAYLNDYGGELSGFLAAFEPAQSLPYLPDVARVEWAINCAVHAPDSPALDLHRLATLDESSRARVRLRVHPGVSLLCLQFPADAIWRAVLDQDAAAMAAVDLKDAPAHVLVERTARGLLVQRLSAHAWQFAARLSVGTPLYEALDGASPQHGEDATALLAEHLASGRFIDFSCTGEPFP